MKKTTMITAMTLAAAFLAGCGNTNAPAGSSEITEEKAKATAFEHAGVNEKDITSLKVTKEKEDGVDVYDIEFTVKDKAYDYDINRKSGEITSSSFQPVSEAQNTPGSSASNSETAAENNTAKNKKENTAKTTTNTAKPADNDPSVNTKEKAKTIALNSANIKESDARRIKVENEWEDGVDMYTVSFYANDIKYEYEIAKSNGAVLDADRDHEGDDGVPTSDMITKAKAESIALNKVKGAKQNHIYLKFDRDDGQYLYEGEIVYDDREYDFEIDPYTGNIIKWSVENLH